jgi:hypothetical protein
MDRRFGLGVHGGGITVARVLHSCMGMNHFGLFLGLTVDIIEFVRIKSSAVGMQEKHHTLILACTCVLAP